MLFKVRGLLIGNIFMWVMFEFGNGRLDSPIYQYRFCLVSPNVEFCFPYIEFVYPVVICGMCNGSQARS